MKLPKINKQIIIATAFILFFLFVPFHNTNASLFDITNVAAKAIGKVAYGINYVIGYLGGVLFSIGGALVNFALELNDRILDENFNSFLYTGWNIVLGFANLAFILVIIVIAFATIFRNQTYGMKQILWRLILAALLVNFSLVIAGVFIDAAGMLTKFFVSKSTLVPSDMSTTLASVFDVHKFMQVQPGQSTANAFENFGSSVLIAISSIFFTYIFTIIAAIVLLAIFVMLLARYIALSFLLMVTPIVMVAWIFPKSKFYQEWWQNFIKWTIFAPIVTFFFYLSITALQNQATKNTITNIMSSGAATAIQNKGFLFSVGVIGQMVVAVGMLVASLYYAQKLGIAGANKFMGMATNFSKGVGAKVGTWAGRKGQRLGTLPFRSEWGKKQIEKIQKGEGLGKVPFVGRRLGHALSNVGVIQGEKLIKQNGEAQKKYSDKQLALRIATMTRDERVAALSRLSQNKNLDMVPDLVKYIKNSNTKNLFESYGQGVAYSNVEKTAGFNTAMANAKSAAEWKKEAEEFFRKFSQADFKKIQYNDIFGDKPNFGLDPQSYAFLQEALAHGIAINNTGMIREVLTNVKPQNFDRAHSAITRVSSDIRAQGTPDAVQLADKIKDTLDKTLAKRFGGELFDFPTGTTPTP